VHGQSRSTVQLLHTSKAHASCFKHIMSMAADQGGSERTSLAERRWGIARKAVRQHRILRCFHTLRFMSDGPNVHFDQLQYVCTLGGARACSFKRSSAGSSL
jgi:hypothetical protein